MVDIECLACDKTLELPQSIDTDNYDGQLVCSECKALLHVKSVKGGLRKYKIVERRRPEKPVVNITVASERAKELTERVLNGEGTEGSS
jgi:hypothetical protein